MQIKYNWLRILGVLALILFVYVFFKIVVYLTIATVLFLIAFPLTYRLEKIRFGKYKLPDSVAAGITLTCVVGIFTFMFYLIIPPLVSEINNLSSLNFYDVLHNTLNQFPNLHSLLNKLGSEEELKQNINSQLHQFATTNNITYLLNNITGYAGTILGGTLCVLFITFFFLKDESLVKQGLVIIAPKGKEKEMRDIFKTSKKMLSNYFAALFIDMLIVGVAVFTILTIFGIKNAVIIAFVAGILNVIPYVGSVITMLLAIFLGVSGCISAGHYDLIGPTINKIFFSLLSINLIDGFLIQPFIFSSSVKAHPLEIFIITLMAGALGGIFGMVVALPVYTLIRITAKEFLTHLKFFKKISDTIEE
ncbi:MAG: AI-2E family transporter [Bacteroidetes bacterium]|nr:AI-2E family transporter [Bacteroidota bacterium]MCA6442569.1 AI-2E family transporter [Bacteroidota bacterium]